MRPLLLTLTLLATAAGTAGAQREAQHQGFWIGFGLGGGSNLTEGYDDARLGGAGYLRLGGTVNQTLLIGGEAIAWVRERDNTAVTQGNLTASVLFYPARRGLYLKTGLGFASWSQAFSSGPTTITTTEGGFGATFGGGYDFQLGRNLFLTPNLDVLIQVVNSDTFQNTSAYLILFTLGLTWH